MIDCEQIFKDDRLFRAFTSLDKTRFLDLLPVFDEAYKAQTGPHKRREHFGRPPILECASERLLFILFYVKCYPTFDLAGFLFGADRSTACVWVHTMLPALEKALDKKAVMPKRKAQDIGELCARLPACRAVIVDGSERPMRRPQDPEKQKRFYSGKKKRHTLKNLVVVGEDKSIQMLSETVAGSVHDLTLLRVTNWCQELPANRFCFMDSGFQGIEREHPDCAIILPTKKPRRRELSKAKKKVNRAISQIRVVVENALAGVKRLNILSHVYRNFKEGFEDRIMRVGCGLWNFWLKTKPSLDIYQCYV